MMNRQDWMRALIAVAVDIVAAALLAAPALIAAAALLLMKLYDGRNLCIQ
jgi:hypothetical protein